MLRYQTYDNLPDLPAQNMETARPLAFNRVTSPALIQWE